MTTRGRRPGTRAAPALPSEVAIVVKGYPRLSETFIAQEILGLQELGQRQVIVSLRHPTDPSVHALNRAITAPVLYLPEYLRDAPGRVAAGLGAALLRRGFWAALGRFLADLMRDPTPNRVRRFGQALVLARELPRSVGWLHSHYLHTPASVTRYAATLRGLPWSFTAHAKDIYTTPDRELRSKLASARWGVTCTEANRTHLAALAPEPGRPGPERPGLGRIERVYHGLDFARFPAARLPSPGGRDGRDPRTPVRLLAVGRAVEKKGFDQLLQALAALPADLRWHLTHIGGGEDLAALARQAQALGLFDRVDWLGAQPQDRVIAAYQAADLFVLPARIARDGDRDGLPNVLMEAQALGVACLSTRLSAIPELIVDGETGVLVPPDDVPALTAALARLIAAPAERARLARAGWARVRERFAFEAGLARLARRFGLPEPQPRPREQRREAGAA